MAERKGDIEHDRKNDGKNRPQRFGAEFRADGGAYGVEPAFGDCNLPVVGNDAHQLLPLGLGETFGAHDIPVFAGRLRHDSVPFERRKSRLQGLRIGPPVGESRLKNGPAGELDAEVPRVEYRERKEREKGQDSREDEEEFFVFDDKHGEKLLESGPE